MKARIRGLIFVCASLLAVGCSTAPTKQQQGAVIGGIAGGVLGNQVGGGSGRVLATIIGTVAGAAVGSSIGKSMDEADRAHTAQVLESQPTGQSSSWVNPDTGNEYAVTPTRTYQSDTGPCREYTMDATIGGETRQVYGTACRQPDGNWKIVS